MIEQELTRFMLESAPLNAKVEKRVYWGNIPQKIPLPAIVLQKRTGGHQTDLSGSAGFATARFMLEVFSTSTLQGAEICEVLRHLFQPVIRQQWGEHLVSIVFEGDEDYYPIPPEDGSERFAYRRVVYLRIWHSESVPTSP